MILPGLTVPVSTTCKYLVMVRLLYVSSNIRVVAPVEIFERSMVKVAPCVYALSPILLAPSIAPSGITLWLVEEIFTLSRLSSLSLLARKLPPKSTSKVTLA